VKPKGHVSVGNDTIATLLLTTH